MNPENSEENIFQVKTNDFIEKVKARQATLRKSWIPESQTICSQSPFNSSDSHSIQRNYNMGLSQDQSPYASVSRQYQKSKGIWNKTNQFF
jgi:hypothetical protein